MFRVAAFDFAADGAMIALSQGGALARRPASCSANAHCAKSPTGHVCDPGTGACVACAMNADCGLDAPTCDPATKTCVACTDDGDGVGSRAGSHCGPASTCVCASNAECAASPLGACCDLLLPRCGCAAAGDCAKAAHPICLVPQHACTDACLTDADCKVPPGEGPFCDAAGAKMCVRCVDDADFVGSAADAHCVLVFSDTGFLDVVTLGNNIADDFDAGGRLVIATFANASVPIQGRWATGNYQLINPAGQQQPPESAALQIVDAASPLVAGVKTLTATAAYRSTGAPIHGGVVVAEWGGGATLSVRGVKNGVTYAALNMYPPSSTARTDFWAGDGATIMKNALAYHGYCHSIVGKNGGVCASGKLEYCVPANPLVGTSAPQALAACSACYGKACVLDNGDCAGPGYGPSTPGVGVDAFFGYAPGCSGDAGRIWSYGTSFTTYGTWAPEARGDARVAMLREWSPSPA